VAEAVRAAGGAVFGLTSEPQTLASEAQRDWGVAFETVGDPHHEIADECRERGWLDLFVNEKIAFLKGHRSWVAHPKGYFQPGVLALARDGRVLYRWRGVPTRWNAGGATTRPTPEHAWEKVRAALEQETGEDAPLDHPESFDSRGPPWPLFVALLLANGNFLFPRGFGLIRGVPGDSNRRVLGALGKLVLFVGGWAAAFAFLPTGWVFGALALWALAVTPGIVHVHREFQSVREAS
jgi:hypothetical protein